MSNATAAALVTRQTSKGLLLVVLTPSGDLAATLAGSRINPFVSRLAKAAQGPLGAITHTIDNCALYATEYAAIEAARAPYAERIALVSAANTDAFPGSRAWLAAQSAAAKLAAFDATHPEIVGGVRAAHEADMASRYQD